MTEATRKLRRAGDAMIRVSCRITHQFIPCSTLEICVFRLIDRFVRPTRAFAASLALILLPACDDVAPPQIRATERAADMPKLQRGSGTRPIARSGGTVRALPDTTRLADLRSSLRGSAQMQQPSTEPLTPYRYLWSERASDGAHALFIFRNGEFGVSLRVMPTEWRMVGAGDYDDDGWDDILWRNTNDGTIAI
jgi:hypothetical protein